MTRKIGIVFLLFISITSVSTVIHYAWADGYTSVPSWIKKISDWWSKGNISDLESVNAFQYLVDKKIINIPGLSFNHDVSFDKQVQQTKMISSFLWNVSDKSTDFRLGDTLVPSSRIHYIYVQPAPAWAPRTDDLVLSATNYWEDISNAKFIYASEPDKASITVRWLKEPDSQYAGYAVGEAIEVALGDSMCDGIWHPYDADFITATLTHELGHALGFGHSSNMGDVMYPIISGEKYAPVKQTFILGPNGSAFVHVCTFSHTSTFHYVVKSTDTKNNLNIFFVPSKMEYEKFTNGEKFNYYTNAGCFETTGVFYDDECSNVSSEGGLIISVPNTLNSQENVTLTMEEQ